MHAVIRHARVADNSDLNPIRLRVFVVWGAIADIPPMKIARDAVVQGKVLAAICIAPSILANAGVLEGVEATSFPSEKGNLIAKGANYTGADLTVDGNTITANGPGAARKFGNAVVDALR